MGTDEGRKQEGIGSRRGVEGSSGKKEPGVSTGLDGTRSERGRWRGPGSGAAAVSKQKKINNKQNKTKITPKVLEWIISGS